MYWWHRNQVRWFWDFRGWAGPSAALRPATGWPGRWWCGRRCPGAEAAGLWRLVEIIFLRMTFWKSPGVSEKLPFRRAGPKSHVFELFFRLENLEWGTEMLRNTAPVSQNRSGTRNIEWVFAHSWHTADFQKQFGHNSKSTRHSKFGSQVLFFVEGSPKSFENDFFEHLLSIFFSFVVHFHAFFQPFFIHSSSILH